MRYEELVKDLATKFIEGRKFAKLFSTDLLDLSTSFDGFMRSVFEIADLRMEDRAIIESVDPVQFKEDVFEEIRKGVMKMIEVKNVNTEYYSMKLELMWDDEIPQDVKIEQTGIIWYGAPKLVLKRTVNDNNEKSTEYHTIWVKTHTAKYKEKNEIMKAAQNLPNWIWRNMARNDISPYLDDLRNILEGILSPNEYSMHHAWLSIMRQMPWNIKLPDIPKEDPFLLNENEQSFEGFLERLIHVLKNN